MPEISFCHAEKPALLRDRDRGAPLALGPLKQLSGNRGKGIFRSRAPLLPVSLCLGARINPVLQKTLRLLPLFTRAGERGFGITAQREQLLFALEAVGEAPELGATRRHLDEQAAAIRFALGLRVRL